MRPGRLALVSLLPCLTALSGWGPVPLPAAYAYEVRVRGSAELELEAIGAGTVLNVRGRLVDDLGKGLAQRRIDLLVENDRRVAMHDTRIYTDFDGRFSWSTDEVPGTYVVTASFGGSEHLNASRGSGSVRLVPEAVELQVDVPAFAHGETAVPARFQASSAGQGVATFVSIYRAGQAVASAQLDTYGRTTFDLGPFVEPGDNAFEFVIEGTAYRREVRHRHNVRRGDALRVEGQVEPVFLRMRRGWELHLSVEDERGGVADLPVTWTVRRDGEEPVVVSTQTDAGGLATTFVESPRGEEARYEAGARVEPPAGRALEWSGQSWEVAPAPLHRVVRLLSLVAVMAALLWFARGIVVRAGRAGRAWWRRWRVGRAATRGKGDAMSLDVARGHEELALSAAHPGSTGDEFSQDALVVELWDRWRERPVERASVWVEGGGSERREARPLGGGVFLIDASHLDGLTLVASAPGFVEARAPLQVRASGRLRLRMSPVPLKVRELYRWLVKRAHGEDLWGSLTPAQIAMTLARHHALEPGRAVAWRSELDAWTRLSAEERPAALLSILTAAVEETNFSGQNYDAELWHRVREIVLELDRLGASAPRERVREAL